MYEMHTDDRSISKRDLFDIWLSKEDRDSKRLALFMHVLRHFGIEYVSKDVEDSITAQIKILDSKFYQKWVDCKRTKSRFINKFGAWLDSIVRFTQLENVGRKSQENPLDTPTSSRGRPKKPFSEHCEKSKQRLIKPLLDNISGEEIITAAQLTLYNEGSRTASSLLKEMTSTSPRRAVKIMKAYKSPPKEIQKMSKEEALATFLDGKMSQRSYMAIKKHLKVKGCVIFPSYHAILNAKIDCYPQDITITEISAEVKLQSLLDHTISRLCMAQKEMLLQVKDYIDQLYCIFKWGCDGSSGYSSYKQRFSENVASNQEDNAIFVISLVPVQLYNIKSDKKQILWQNPCASSTRWCRPIKLLLKSESDSLIKSEIAKIRDQIVELNRSKVFLGEINLEINCKLCLCMVDGKICSSVMDISSQTCYICGCTPKNMNEKQKLTSFSNNPESYQFGLSPLHAKIRTFECLLKICYRLELKTWQVRGAENKQKIADKKRIVQQEFREKTGLLVDVVKVGYGTTNDGNTARRFFEHPSLSASITGLDETLIKKLSVLLEVIASNYEIDVERLRSYCDEIFDRYLELYPWFCMPVTLHKLLVHSSVIIEHAMLPIGLMSEEAQECRHKEIKRLRECSTRKCSRKETMKDLFNSLLYTSDPFINSLREKPRRPIKSLSPEARALLKNPSTDGHEYSTEDSDSSETTSTEAMDY